jgi:hypothetical protein
MDAKCQGSPVIASGSARQLRRHPPSRSLSWHRHDAPRGSRLRQAPWRRHPVHVHPRLPRVTLSHARVRGRNLAPHRTRRAHRPQYFQRLALSAVGCTNARNTQPTHSSAPRQASHLLESARHITQLLCSDGDISRGLAMSAALLATVPVAEFRSGRDSSRVKRHRIGHLTGGAGSDGPVREDRQAACATGDVDD